MPKNKQFLERLHEILKKYEDCQDLNFLLRELKRINKKIKQRLDSQ